MEKKKTSHTWSRVELKVHDASLSTVHEKKNNNNVNLFPTIWGVEELPRRSFRNRFGTKSALPTYYRVVASHAEVASKPAVGRGISTA